MKKQLKNILILAGMAFLTFACQQENDGTPKQLEVEVDEVVEVIINQFLSVGISGGDENEPFSSDLGNEEDLNARISLDDSEERGTKTMIACLVTLDLEQSQMQEIRRSFFGFENCQSNVMLDYRSEVRSLIFKMEEVRKDMLVQLRNGEILPDEFRKKMEEMKRRNQLIIVDLRGKYAEDLKPCIRGFVARLPIILGRENWTAFRECIKG